MSNAWLRADARAPFTKNPRPMPRPALVPLSEEQRGIWLDCQLTPHSAFYNVPATLRFDHAADVGCLRFALDELVRRHEALRTAFGVDAAGQPYQVIASPVPFPLHVVEEGDSSTVAAADALARDRYRPFDLTAAPPLARGVLVVGGSGGDTLGLTFHHAVVDGWSLAILVRELSVLYAARRSGTAPKLAAPKVQCADYALWQAERGPSAHARALAYLEKKLRGPRHAVRLPYDRPRPPVPRRRGGFCPIRLAPELTERAASMARAERMTVFGVLLAAFELFLHAETGQTDFLVGSPFANRTYVETESTVGMLATTIALRLDLAGDPKLVDVLRRTRETVFDAFAHPVPFSVLAEHQKGQRGAAQTPLVQVAFSLQPKVVAPVAGSGITPTLDVLQDVVTWDLEGHLWEAGGAIEGGFAYDADLFDEATVRRMTESYVALLGKLLDRTSARLSEIVPPDPRLQRIASAVLEDPCVADCAVLARHAPGRGRELVAYVVPDGPFRDEDAASRVLEAFGEDHVPSAWVHVARIPLRGGEVDEDALAALEVVDDSLLHACERAFGAAGDTEGTRTQVAALVRPWSEPARKVKVARAPAPAAAVTRALAASDAPRSIACGEPLPALPVRTLPEALARAADELGNQGVVFVSSDGLIVERSYGWLRDEAQKVAAGLRSLGLSAGTPVLLQLSRNEDVLVALWGTVIAGLVAVPLAVPPALDAGNGLAARLLAACSLLEPAVVVTNEAGAFALQRFAPHVRVVAFEPLREHAPLAHAPAAAPDDLALLFLTSGSTGTPKAVQQTHRTLLSQAAACALQSSMGSADVSLNWIALDHAGGVCSMHLTPLLVGARQVHAPTSFVMQQPLRWLDLASAHRATFTAAPNFAYALINELAADVGDRRWDLSSLRHIINAGESIVSRTARRFLALLEPHGLPATAMKPTWGMSETCSGVIDSHTFTRASTSDDGFVDLGKPAAGFEVRVVDAEGRIVPEGTVGALEVRGASVTPGYFRGEALNAAAFTSDGWFRTGDLAAMRNGRLTLTGREKDVIIVNGQNFYSHEVEAIAETAAGAEPSYVAATAVRSARSETDEVAIFLGTDAPEEALAVRVREKVTRETGIRPEYVVLVPRAEIPKTSLGKIERAKLRARFERGELGVHVYASPSAQGAAGDDDLPAWFHVPTWERRNLARSAPASTPLSARVVGEGPLAESLRGAVGSAFEQPGQPADRVICVLEACDDGAAASTELSDAWRVVSLVQALARDGNHRAKTLLVVTRSAFAVEADDRPIPAIAAVAALVKTVRAEYPSIDTRHLDLGQPQVTDVDVVLAELSAATKDACVAWRMDRWVQRLQRKPPRAGQGPVFVRGGLYVVAGGTGAVGSLVVEHLRKAWDARVAVLSRTLGRGERWPHEADPHVRTILADVTDEDAVRAAVREAEAAFGTASSGLLHLAGVGAEGPIDALTPSALAAAVHAKVAGTLVLDRIARERPDVALVLFSSVNGFFGGANVAAYAMANAFVDAHAEGAARSGRTVTSIAWSAWAGLGMSAAAATSELSSRRGFVPLDKTQALASLEVALAVRGGHVLVGLDESAAPVQRLVVEASPRASALGVVVEAAEAPPVPPLFDRYGVPVDVAVEAMPALPRTGDGRIDMAALVARGARSGRGSGTPPATALERQLADVWRDVLRLDAVGVEQTFFELGGHSLLAIRMLARLKADLGVELSLPALLEAPTVRALARRVAGEAPSASRAAASPVVLVARPDERFDPFPLTDVQAAYFVGRTRGFELGGVSAHEYIEYLCPDLDVTRFAVALQGVIARHDMLRAVVRSDGQQQVLPLGSPYEIEVCDLRGVPAKVREATLRGIRERMSHAVHPVDVFPMFDFRVTYLDEGVLLHIDVDGLLIDAHSWEIVTRELVRLYREPSTTLPALGLTFRDYVLAEKRLRDSAEYQRSAAYWRERIASLPPPPELPLAKAPAAVARPRFTRRAVRLDRAAFTQFDLRARRVGVTASVALLTCLAEALGRYTARPRFALNLTLFNRLPLHADVDAVVGDFTTLSLLGVDLEARAAFAERASAVQSQLHQDLEHRHVNSVSILAEHARKTGRPTTFPVVFSSGLVLGQGEGGSEPLSGLGTRRHSITQTPQVWIDCQVTSQDGALDLVWDAVDEIFPEGLLDACFADYQELVHALAGDDQAWRRDARTTMGALAAPPIVTPEALPTKRLEELVAASVVRNGARPAVLTRDRVLSYDELWSEQSRLAVTIRRARPKAPVGAASRELGSTPLVAIVMDKGIEQIVAALACLSAGVAYLPIDAALPSERITHLLEAGGITVALTQPGIRARVTWPDGVLPIEVQLGAPTELDDVAQAVEGAAAGNVDDVAYVIFTSGSTGKPKGVVVDHRAAANTIVDVNRRFAVGPTDRVLALSSLSFDLSVWDVFGTLAAGGAIVLPDGTPDPAQWGALCRDRRVTIWNSVPALMTLMIEYTEAHDGVLDSLRLALLSGDWIPVSLPDRLRRATSARVVSLGGATEAAIWSILHPIDAVDSTWKSIPYGRAMDNQSVHVLDADLAPCPKWVPGEIFIGGAGLARGYLGDPEQTRARFLIHPRSGERLYRTGDFGRLLPDGNIEFLGRRDAQVKVQGHRIELGEVEAALVECPGVAESAVVAVGPRDGERRLVGFVVTSDRCEAKDLAGFERRALAHLTHRLPRYMVPNAVHVVASLPLTSNGKVDRSALGTLADTQSAPAAAVAPASPERSGATDATAAVQAVTAIVAAALGQDEVDCEANLFALGATSITMVRIVNGLERDFGVRPNIQAVYTAPTVKGLASLVGPVDDVRRPAEAGSEHQPILLHPDERDAFKRRKLGIRRPVTASSVFALPQPALDFARLARRKSVRTYEERKVSAPEVAAMLGTMRELEDGRRAHGSAGGLYPVQVYVQIKPGRVEGLPGGTYYYDPEAHHLLRTGDSSLAPDAFDVLVNRPIAEAAAFGIFLVLRASAIVPMYGVHAERLATLEAGAMAQLLETAAPEIGLGLCAIGGLDWERVRGAFDVDGDDRLLHMLLGGPSGSEREEGVL